MATLGSLVVEVGANVARLQKDLAKMNRHVRRQTNSMKRMFRGVAKVASGFLGAQMLRKIVDVTTAQQNALNQLEAGIRSTGGAAGQSVEQLAQFAASMQKVTTYGDEAVMEMQSVLLTFTKVSGDTFPRASKAILDVATRMGTDLKSAALQVGKALNDPIANMGGLSRAGIQFTKDQKAVIKALWESGKQAEAQAVILKELETQFKGSARAARDTLGGAIQALKNTFWDFFEVGKSGAKPLVAAINLLASQLNNLLKIALSLAAAALPMMFLRLVKAIRAATAAMLGFNAAAAANPLILIASVIAAGIALLWQYRDTLVSVGNEVKNLGDWAMGAVKGFASSGMQAMEVMVRFLFGVVKITILTIYDMFNRARDIAKGFIKGTWAMLKGDFSFKALGEALSGDFVTGFVGRLKELDSSLRKAWNRQWFSDVKSVASDWSGITQEVEKTTSAFKKLTPEVNKLGGSLKGIKKLFKKLSLEGVAFAYKFSKEMQAIAEEIQESFSTAFDSIQSDWEAMNDEMAWATAALPDKAESTWRDLVASWQDTGKAIEETTVNMLRSIQGGFHSLFSKALKGEINSFQDAFDAAFDIALDIVTSVAAQIATTFTMRAIGPMIGGIGDWVSSLLQGSQTAGLGVLDIMGPTGWAITGGIAAVGLLTMVWDDFGETMMDIFEGIGDFIFGIFEQIVNAAKDAAEAAGNAFGSLGDIASDIPIVGPVVDTASDIIDSIGDVFGGLFHKGGMVPVVAHRGMFLGRSLASDEVPVIAQRGEFIVRKDAVTPATLPILEDINSGRGGGNTINMNYTIDARGAAPGVERDLRTELERHRVFLKRLITQTHDPLVT